jgi:2,4-diketo-3-deoxy-L-fuconate hydrolase
VKLGTILTTDGVERVACLLDETQGILAPREMGDLIDIIKDGPGRLTELAALASGAGAERFQLATVRILAPIRRFNRDILCTGWNYWDHFYESEGKREGQDVPKPDAPTFFTKGPGVTIGPYDSIAFDEKVSGKWDYEAEVALIIGKAGRSIPQDRAMEHVFGYCVANDVSQRDLQRRHGGQWLKGKSIDQTMPLGPWISLRDDVDLSQVTIEFELNGKLMQQASVSQMAFSIPELIAELSFGMMLLPGDVILTGTPSGIGNARTPPVFLRQGDELIARATGLGELRNRMTSIDLSSYQR